MLSLYLSCTNRTTGMPPSLTLNLPGEFGFWFRLLAMCACPHTIIVTGVNPYVKGRIKVKEVVGFEPTISEVAARRLSSCLYLSEIPPNLPPFYSEYNPFRNFFARKTTPVFGHFRAYRAVPVRLETTTAVGFARFARQIFPRLGCKPFRHMVCFAQSVEFIETRDGDHAKDDIRSTRTRVMDRYCP